MRIVIVAILVLLGFVRSATSEEVQIRSGEHDGFSRLVLQFATEIPAWTVLRNETGYELQLSGQGYDLDVADVFRRINHDRLHNVQYDPDDSVLNFTVECSCYIDAFEFRNQKLVIDIKSGEPPAESPFERVAEANPEPEGVSPPTITEPEGAQPFHVELPIRMTSRAAPPPQPQLEFRIPEQVGNDDIAGGSPENTSIPDEKLDERILETQTALLNQISRAAAQGLIQAKPIEFPSEQAPPEMPRQSVGEELQPEDVHSHINVVIESSIDQSLRNPENADHQSGAAENCALGQSLDIISWGSSNDIIGAISAARKNLVADIDYSDEEAIDALAKATLYAGFGVEAQEVILTLAPDHPQAVLLHAIGSILDGSDSIHFDSLQDLTGCPNIGAVWGVLATEDLSSTTNIDRNAIIANVSALPLHLRRLIGPKLVEKFLSIDDTETAEALRSITKRAGESGGASSQLMDAQLAHAYSNFEESDATLLNILHRNPPESADAILLLLTSLLDRGADIDPELIETLDAQVYMLRDGNEWPALQQNLIIAKARNGNFSGAFESLLQLHEKHPQNPIMSETITGIIPLFVDTTTDANFAARIYATRSLLENVRLERQTRALISARLSRLGLPELSRDRSQPIRSGPHVSDANPWRGGDWRSVSDSEPLVVARAAKLMLRLDNTDGEADEDLPPLRQGEELLGQSSSDRALLTDLLDQFPSPAPNGL